MSRTTVDTSKTVALVIATTASFFMPYMGSSVNIALPTIGREFSMSAVLMGWVPTSYLLAGAVFLLPLGRVADIYGRKRVYACGMALYTVSCLLVVFSHSAGLLIFLRTLQGLGSGVIFGTGVAILSSVFPAEERGKALGINAAATYLGLSTGPFLGGFLTQHLGWRSIFLLNVPLGFMIIALILWKMKGEWSGAKGERMDLAGAVYYGLSLVVIMYGFSRLPETVGIIFAMLGMAGMLLFIRFEFKAPSPLLNVRLFRSNPVFIFSNLATLINYSATYAVAFLLSLYLQYIKGASPAVAGLILVSQPIAMTVISPIAGRLSDRVEPRIVASIGMAMTCAGLLAFTLLNKETPVALIIAILVALGAGFGLFSSPNMNAVMGSVEKKLYGVASATMGTMRLIGNMLSMGIVMITFAVYMGRTQVTPEYYPAFLASAKIAFVIFAATCFAGIFASLARGKVR